MSEAEGEKEMMKEFEWAMSGGRRAGGEVSDALVGVSAAILVYQGIGAG